MGIQRYVFFSIYDCDKHPEVPLMNIKAATEKFLESSGLNYTVFRLCGFHQVRDFARSITIMAYASCWPIVGRWCELLSV